MGLQFCQSEKKLIYTLGHWAPATPFLQFGHPLLQSGQIYWVTFFNWFLTISHYICEFAFPHYCTNHPQWKEGRSWSVWLVVYLLLSCWQSLVSVLTCPHFSFLTEVAFQKRWWLWKRGKRGMSMPSRYCCRGECLFRKHTLKIGESVHHSEIKLGNKRQIKH